MSDLSKRDQIRWQEYCRDRMLCARCILIGGDCHPHDLNWEDCQKNPVTVEQKREMLGRAHLYPPGKHVPWDHTR